jgi:tRNA threonylcarbamoyladenosine biosynthesis protein TsaE
MIRRTRRNLTLHRGYLNQLLELTPGRSASAVVASNGLRKDLAGMSACDRWTFHSPASVNQIQAGAKVIHPSWEMDGACTGKIQDGDEVLDIFFRKRGAETRDRSWQSSRSKFERTPLRRCIILACLSLNSHSIEFISRSPEQTRRVGMRLGGMLQTGDVIGLVGDLGSGKTTLMQGVASGWGSLDPVTSPTFVLVNVYRHPEGGRLFHLDAYRLSGPAEAEDLDVTAMLDAGPLRWNGLNDPERPPTICWWHATIDENCAI